MDHRYVCRQPCAILYRALRCCRAVVFFFRGVIKTHDVTYSCGIIWRGPWHSAIMDPTCVCKLLDSFVGSYVRRFSSCVVSVVSWRNVDIRCGVNCGIIWRDPWHSATDHRCVCRPLDTFVVSIVR